MAIEQFDAALLGKLYVTKVLLERLGQMLADGLL